MEKKVRKSFVMGIMALLLLAFLIPLYAYAYYTVPLADDFNMTAPVYKAWLNSGNVIDAIGTAWQQAMLRYKTWAGEYICMFLQGLPIGLGSYRLYFLSSWVILSIYIGAGYYFGKVFLIDFMHTDRNTWFMLSSIIFIFLTAFLPDIYDAFYWHTTAVSYTLAVAVKLVVVAQMFFTLLVEKKINKIKYLLLLLIVFLVPGIEGSFTQTSFFVAMSMICFIAIIQKKKRLLAFTSWVIMVIGWLVVLLAPGNMVRQTSNYGETTSIPMVLWESMQRGVDSISENMNFPLLLITLIVLPMGYKAVKHSEHKFKFPGVVTLFSIGIYAASFSPWIFSRGAEAPNPYGGDSGYVQNVFWMIFVILWFFNVIYWLGWSTNFFTGVQETIKESSYKKLKLSFYAVLLLLVLFWSMKLEHVMEYTSPRVLWHILNGNAEHYYTAMLEREELLLDNPKELLAVPEIDMPISTGGAGDITEDADNWVNKAVQAYYGLQVGVCVQKEEISE